MDRAMGGDPARQQPLRADPAREPTDPADAEDAFGHDESWRREVVARLERYHSRRRPRIPRYPSLFLPFDVEQSRERSRTSAAPPGISTVHTRHSTALQREEELAADSEAIADVEPAVNVLEFPGSAALPLFQAPELAEPVLDRPLIVEAPEMLPPPPALGGMLIESPAAKEADKVTEPEIPLTPATIPRRLAAASVDALLLGTALSAFAAVFLRLNPVRVPLPLLVGSSVAVALMLWCTYEFLFVVYTGSTPGLRALKLRLVRFDGSPVPRRSRRWRVLASFLSACSLGLGYLWSVLDEDGLCWHDRITHTHVQASNPTP
jgi:uncharacterized RDD family membrane protein YckC